MIVFPAIDLIAGKVVRLERGEREHMRTYSCNPVSEALRFREAGATWIHVVDLSATFEEDQDARDANLAAIKELASIEGVSIDCGGGVRSLSQLESLLDLGIKRVALGTALVRDPQFAERAAQDYADYVVADVAAKDGVVRVNGWREGEELSLERLIDQLKTYGFKHLVFTDIARDGMQTGIDAQSYSALAQLTRFPVVASGGIAALEDIERLRELGDDVIEGCIIGRALYEGSFTLKEALLKGQGELGAD